MKLILLTHPAAFVSASMPRFAGLIARGMKQRGHAVELWTAAPQLGRLPVRSGFIRKWLGYADQFLIYPRELRRRVAEQPRDTVFVVTDQALGMWVPSLMHRPHVIHCHDFLALRSARGEFPEHPTGWSGRQYQRLIRRGFSRGRAFISVSGKTRADLHRFLPSAPEISEVVHNGLNHPFRPMNPSESAALLKPVAPVLAGFIVHVGGNQWYKNRKGVLEIYRAYAASVPNPAALWMIGAPPSASLKSLAATIRPPGEVRFLSGLTNEQVNAAYAQARCLLFPSLEEGFGWPVIEAMASGCPVATTDVAPLNEIAGGAARLIPRMPVNESDQKAWAISAATILNELVSLDEENRTKMLEAGKSNALRFDAEKSLEAYEKIYLQALTAN